MNKYQRKILEEIKKQAKAAKRLSNFDLPKYLGHQHKQYHLSTPQKREIAKSWAKANKDISANELSKVLSALYQGESYEEKVLAGWLLGYMPKQRQQLSLDDLAKWLTSLVGWAEIDGTCQGSFTPQDILPRWAKWRRFLIKLSKSRQIAHRRASLVLLTKQVRDSVDPRLAKLALINIDQLKYEKDILITKAVSWLLRDLIKHHRSLVQKYLKENSDTLPKIALRETRRKLKTGRK